MAKTNEGGALARRRPQIFVQSTTTNRPSNTPSGRSTQVRRAIAEALDDLDPASRPAMLRWLTGIGLVGLAGVQGFGEAARLAYSYGDALAVRGAQ